MSVAERITIAVVYTNGSPDEITAAILAAVEPEMAVVKAAVHRAEVFETNFDTGDEAVDALEAAAERLDEAVRAYRHENPTTDHVQGL